MKKFYLATLLACVFMISTGTALAQFAKPEHAIKYRQSSFFVMQQNFSRIVAMVRGKVPFNAQEAKQSAEVAAYMSKLPWAAFGPGTEGGKAKEAVWHEPEKFQKGAKQLQTNMAKLVNAANTGDLDAIKAAVRATGKTCKACHDNFKKK